MNVWDFFVPEVINGNLYDCAFDFTGEIENSGNGLANNLKVQLINRDVTELLTYEYTIAVLAAGKARNVLLRTFIPPAFDTMKIGDMVGTKLLVSYENMFLAQGYLLCELPFVSDQSVVGELLLKGLSPTKFIDIRERRRIEELRKDIPNVS